MAFRAPTASSSSMQRPTMNAIPATPTAHKGEWVPASSGGQLRSTCLSHLQVKQIKFYCLVLMYHQDGCFITEQGRGNRRWPASSWLLGEVCWSFQFSLKDTWPWIFNSTIRMWQTSTCRRKRKSRKWQREERKRESGKSLLCSPFLRSHWSLYVIFNKGWIDIILYLTPRRVYATSVCVISPLLSDSQQLTEA